MPRLLRLARDPHKISRLAFVVSVLLVLGCAPTAAPEALPQQQTPATPAVEQALPSPSLLSTLPQAEAVAREWMEDAACAGVLEFIDLDRAGHVKGDVVWTFCSLIAVNREPDEMPLNEQGRPMYVNQLKVTFSGGRTESKQAAGEPTGANENTSELKIDSDQALNTALAAGGSDLLGKYQGAQISARLLSGSAMLGHIYRQKDAAAAGETYERVVPKAIEEKGLPPHWMWCVRFINLDPRATLEIFIDAATGRVIDSQYCEGSGFNYLDSPAGQGNSD